MKILWPKIFWYVSVYIFYDRFLKYPLPLLKRKIQFSKFANLDKFYARLNLLHRFYHLYKLLSSFDWEKWKNLLLVNDSWFSGWQISCDKCLKFANAVTEAFDSVLETLCESISNQNMHYQNWWLNGTRTKYLNMLNLCVTIFYNIVFPFFFWCES